MREQFTKAFRDQFIRHISEVYPYLLSYN